MEFNVQMREINVTRILKNKKNAYVKEIMTTETKEIEEEFKR
jgi:hypothetical protein